MSGCPNIKYRSSVGSGIVHQSWRPLASAVAAARPPSTQSCRACTLTLGTASYANYARYANYGNYRYARYANYLLLSDSSRNTQVDYTTCHRAGVFEHLKIGGVFSRGC